MESLTKEFSIDDIKRFIDNNSELLKDKEQFIKEIEELADVDGIMDAIVPNIVFGDAVSEQLFKTL